MQCTRFVLLFCAMALSAARVISPAQQEPASYTNQNADVGVPMRNGVVLRADILLPSVEGRFPTLVYRTPYGKHFALKEYTTFAKAVTRGYAVVVQDVRRRYPSERAFVPYPTAARDA